MRGRRRIDGEEGHLVLAGGSGSTLFFLWLVDVFRPFTGVTVLPGARCQVLGARCQVPGMSQCLPTCPGAAIPRSIIPGRGATLCPGLVQVQVQV